MTSPEPRRSNRLVAAIDALSQRIGQGAAWLTLLMVLLGAYNALARWFGRFLGLSLGSNSLIELQWMLFSLVFLFGAADTLRRQGHVRVDVLYARLSPRRRTLVDLFGTTVFLLPFAVLLLVSTWPMAWESWRIGEASADAGGLPRYPLKLAMLVAFTMLVLQGLGELARLLRAWRDQEREPPGSQAPGFQAPGSQAPGFQPPGSQAPS